MNRKDGVIVTSQELLLQNFDGDPITVLVRSPIVDLGRVTFAKGANDFELAIEDWVLRALAFRLCLYHLRVLSLVLFFYSDKYYY